MFHKLLNMVYKRNKAQDFSPEMVKFYEDFTFFSSRLSSDRGFLCTKSTLAPRLTDATAITGYDNDYLGHAAWATRAIQAINPDFHTDFASNLYFVAMLSAFVPTKFYDYRPPSLNFTNLEVDFVNMTNMPFHDASLPCVSSLSVIEHIGLGRYGDQLDPDGDLKAINEIKRITQKAGSVLINVPIGKSPLIAFNAHRIYSKEQIEDLFSGFILKDFSFLDRKSVV